MIFFAHVSSGLTLSTISNSAAVMLSSACTISLRKCMQIMIMCNEFVVPISNVINCTLMKYYSSMYVYVQCT